MSSGPDTNGVLSKPAEVAFKLLVLLLGVAGAGFAANQVISGRHEAATSAQVERLERNLNARIDKLTERIDSLMDRKSK